MSKMIQIRNVPDSLHAELKARAALEGMSLSAFLLGELRRTLERPPRRELIARFRRRRRDALLPSPADVLREDR